MKLCVHLRKISTIIETLSNENIVDRYEFQWWSKNGQVGFEITLFVDRKSDDDIPI
jgi:hypothetical protein